MNLKIFENSRPSASNFKSFSRSLEHFFLTVGQNNFGNKIPFKVHSFLKLSFAQLLLDTFQLTSASLKISWKVPEQIRYVKHEKQCFNYEHTLASKFVLPNTYLEDFSYELFWANISYWQKAKISTNFLQDQPLESG